MLEKNGERLFQDAEDTKRRQQEIKDKFHFSLKKAAQFKLASRFWKWDANNGRWRVPNEFSVDTEFTVSDPKDGSIHLRYYENERQRPIGGNIITESLPLHLQILNGTITLDPVNDIEKIYYLLHHPRCQGSPYEDAQKSTLFYLFNEEIQEEKRAKTHQRKYKLEQVIWDPKHGYDDNQLIEAAKAMGLGSSVEPVEDMKIERVRMFLQDRVSKAENAKKPMEALQNLLDYFGSGDVEFRSLVKEAEDHDIIMYKSKKWYFNIEGHDIDSKIIGVPPGKDQYDALVEYLKKPGDPEHVFHFLKHQLKGKKEEAIKALSHTDFMKKESEGQPQE